MNIFCRQCGTENEEKYTYCKNCGTPLRTTETKSTQATDFKPNFYSDRIPNEIDGIPSEEVSHFINKNSFKILDKFAKMSCTGSKISWCWPAAILSFFFGFFGAAFWLFYRKMYKIGTIALAVGMIIYGISFAVVYKPTVELVNKTAALIYEMQGDPSNVEAFDEGYTEAFNKYSTDNRVLISSAISEFTNYFAAVFFGLFAMYIYKNHAIKKITAYREVNKDNEYYLYGLSALGGTSIGMAILAVFIAVIVLYSIIAIPLFAFVF